MQPGQEALTPAQEAEARRFAEEYIRRQLSTEPVDEQEAEALLCQAYTVAGLAPPQRIRWVDSPLQLVTVLAPPNPEANPWDRVRDHVCTNVQANVFRSIRASVGARLWDSVEASFRDRTRASVMESLEDSVMESLEEGVLDSVEESVFMPHREVPVLAFYLFFDVYFAPNDLHALARFNGLVSGYWLGSKGAAIVRRPRLLACDAEGRLHSATGKCVEYHDGWGWYAWHGVRVPAQVILAPETLTRKDFLNEENVEVRRVIQERMGHRFVSELGGQVIDSSSRGTLYEVALLDDDPDRVARYVQVQDASTER